MILDLETRKEQNLGSWILPLWFQLITVPTIYIWQRQTYYECSLPEAVGMKSGLHIENTRH